LHAIDFLGSQLVVKKSILLSQQIFDRLESLIGDRVYPPGAKLAEDVIATELGVSRTPVREAFRMLARAGWIEIYPHAGAYVRNPSMEEIRQVFEVRQCLEERAAQLAARHANDAEKRELRKIIERGRREVARGNAKQISALNATFHSVIAVAGRNQILARMVEDLSKQVRWHFSAVATIRGEASWNEHEQIVDALDDADSDKAGTLAVEHSRRTQEALFRQLLPGEGSVSSVAT
jgi:DNA-binding GntR family transcriptional regulator